MLKFIMKRAFWGLRIPLAAVALLALLASSAHAETTRYNAKGGIVTAEFVDRTDDCGITYTFLQAYEETRKEGSGGPDKTGHVFIETRHDDGCTGASTYHYGDTGLLAGEFDVTRLDAAVLTKSMELCGPYGCAMVDIDLAWTGSGDTSKTRYTSHSTNLGTRIHQQGTGAQREIVDVAGSIRMGDRELAVGDTYTYFGAFSQGWIMIEK